MQTDSKQSGLQPARYRNTRSRWQVWILQNPVDLALLWFRCFPQNTLNWWFFLISSTPKTWSKELIVSTKCGLIKNTGELEMQKVAHVPLHPCSTCFKWAVPPPMVTGMKRMRRATARCRIWLQTVAPGEHSLTSHTGRQTNPVLFTVLRGTGLPWENSLVSPL